MANRYWVGGANIWDANAATKWSATSGGAGGASVPTSVDDVFFTNLSTGTCVISAGNTGARSINCTGFTGELAGSAAITVSGSVTLVAGMAYTYTGTMTINATSTLTSGGKTHGNITLNSSGTLTLGDACTLGTTRNFALNAGTLNLNGFTLSTGVFITTTSNTRAITFGSANIALTSTAAASNILIIQFGTNFSWTGTGGFTRNQASTANVDVFGGGGGTVSNAVNLTVNAGSSTLTFTTAGWFKNLIFTGSTCTVTGSVNMAGNLTLASGGTYTSVVPTFRASGIITSAGRTLGNTTINGSGIAVTLAGPTTVGTTNTTTLTAGTLNLAGFTLSTGIFSSSGTTTREISFGAGNIALTSTTAATTVLSMATATNFTFTGTGGFTRNMAATATVVFGTTGGTASNAPNLTVNAGSSLLTITTNSWFKNLDFTGSTSAVTASSLNIAGNLTLASGGTYTGITPTFRSSGTITSTGKTLGTVTINASGATVTLVDAITSSGALNLIAGTFANPSNHGVTARNFVSNSGNTRSLNMGASTWTITGGDSNASWVVGAANLTFSAGTSTINLTYVGTKEFFGDSRTYYNVNVGGTGDFYIYGTNTFNNITNSVQPTAVIFESGTTTTVSNFGLSGTAGNLITISSEAAGFQFTLSKASGTINAQYLSIQDSIATGGATWNALTSNGNVDAGNNTGWIFGSAATGNMFLMFN